MVPRRDASGPGGWQHQRSTGRGQSSFNDADNRPEWLKVADVLIKLEGELANTTTQDLQRTLREAVRRLRRIEEPTRPHREIIDTINNGFKGLEKRLTSFSEGPKLPPKATTWASVAAAHARPAVRVRIPEATNKPAEEILAQVKPIIPGAYAVRQLRSGDIEVTVPDQRSKDQALNQQDTGGYKILRQDYPIEVPGVPLSTAIRNRKDPENEETIKAICRANKRMIPNMAINRIRWMHDDKTQEERKKNGKTRGTVLISFSTQALQHEAVRKGIVIDSQIYDVRLYSQSLEVKQCFKCNQWGHTQSSCSKQDRCGECAGPHQTRECPKQKVSCCNCGKPHRAWQRKECRNFEIYLKDIQTRRVKMVAETAAIRAMAGPPASTSGSSLSDMGFVFTAAGKRGRGKSPETTGRATQPPSKKGPGRPTTIDILGRDRTQSRIENLFSPATASQPTSQAPIQTSSQAPQVSQESTTNLEDTAMGDSQDSEIPDSQALILTPSQ
jgi:hypothetical protein